MAVIDPDRLVVARHLGIPSPTALEVLRSGVRGYDREAGLIIGVTRVDAFEGQSPDSGRPLGSGWSFSTNFGEVFLPDGPEGVLFKAVDYQVLTVKVDAVQLVVDVVELEQKLNAMLPRTVVIPYVDIVEYGFSVKKGFFSSSSCLLLSGQDQHGLRRDICLKGGKDTFAGLFLTYFERRWEREFEELARQVIHEALGGEAFWTKVKDTLRQRRLRAAPVDPSLTVATLLRPYANSPRVIDGPPETLEVVQDETREALERSGFVEPEALAALYINENGWDATSGFLVPAWKAALKDQKFAAALLERWLPSHQAYRATFDPRRGTSLDYSGALDLIEKAARGEPPQ